VADTREEQFAANAPNQQTGESNRFAVAPDIPIRLLARQLAEHRTLRVAGSIDQGQEGQRQPSKIPCKTPKANSPAMTIAARANSKRLRANRSRK
jgi:hypothetical protein